MLWKRKRESTALAMRNFNGSIVSLGRHLRQCKKFSPKMMFKDSRLPLMVETTVIVDKGYQGITKIHANTLIPFKTSKKHKLTPNQKKHNSVIERKRIVIEHVNRYLKRFRLLSSRYRNKQKRFALRFALIAGIYNFQHQLLVSEWVYLTLP